MSMELRKKRIKPEIEIINEYARTGSQLPLPILKIRRGLFVYITQARLISLSINFFVFWVLTAVLSLNETFRGQKTSHLCYVYREGYRYFGILHSFRTLRPNSKHRLWVSEVDWGAVLSDASIGSLPRRAV